MTRREYETKYWRERYQKDKAYRKVALARGRAYKKKRYKTDSEWRTKMNTRYQTDPQYKANQLRAQLMYQYGLTEDQLAKMKIKQAYKCLICNKKKRLVIDHDHKTGKVRGLLCYRCNSRLCLFEDKIIFKRVLRYLGI